MSRPAERLIAIEGVNNRALLVAARALVSLNRHQRAATSRWDASGIFGEVAVADVGAGEPSARTLLLLYAADLAFRLRWEIRPALAAGRLVIVAPYTDTAIAFGLACGLDAEWLADMFNFAPRPASRRVVDAAAARLLADRKGFVEFGCRQILGEHAVKARTRLVKQTAVHLRSMARRASRASRP